jgi:hypothetical protein
MTDNDPLAKQIEEIARLMTQQDRLCGWGGCTAEMPPGTTPRGWVRLTITGEFDARAMVLCSKHARELDDLLKGAGGVLGDFLGSA